MKDDKSKQAKGFFDVNSIPFQLYIEKFYTSYATVRSRFISNQSSG